MYVERIRDAMRNGYQLRNIEHVVHGPYGLDRVLLISMIGIVENGHVLRFWGSGRDVTAMREAETALAQHDSQLRALATEITLAEERARRKLASELHDGPAQNLAGMAMQLAELRRKTQEREQLTLLDETDQVLADTTLQTRTLMLELAPPGLHESGLIEALRWLAGARRQAAAPDRHRRGRWRAEIAGRPGQRAAVPDGARAAAERHQARPLKRAAVRCSVVDDVFTLDVIDPGVGFEVHSIDRLPTRQGGFGLFNIRERLKPHGRQRGYPLHHR